MANIEGTIFYVGGKPKSRIDLLSEPGKDSLSSKTFVRTRVIAGQSAADKIQENYHMTPIARFQKIYIPTKTLASSRKVAAALAACLKGQFSFTCRADCSCMAFHLSASTHLSLPSTSSQERRFLLQAAFKNLMSDAANERYHTLNAWSCWVCPFQAPVASSSADVKTQILHIPQTCLLSFPTAIFGKLGPKYPVSPSKSGH